MKRVTSLIIIIFINIVIYGELYSQWFYFGRNKVQYTNFDWHVLKTDHFDIYYYPEMQDLAEQGASFAEESYEYLENKFNFTINRRIPLIFYSTHLHFQQTNVTPSFIPEGVGGFFEFLKGRVVIPSNGNLNQFRKVICHELVHVFMHSKVYFTNKEHSRFEGTYPPLWFVEGLAEYWSSKWDAQAEMVIKDAVLHNYIVPLSQEQEKQEKPLISLGLIPRSLLRSRHSRESGNPESRRRQLTALPSLLYFASSAE